MPLARIYWAGALSTEKQILLKKASFFAKKEAFFIL